MDIPKVRFKQMLSSNDVFSLKSVRNEFERLGMRERLPEYMGNLDTYIDNMIRYKAYYAEDEAELQEPNQNDYTSTACTIFAAVAVICIIAGIVNWFILANVSVPHYYWEDKNVAEEFLVEIKHQIAPYVGLTYITTGVSGLLSASMIGKHFKNQFLQAQVQYRGAKAQCEALNRLYNAVKVPDDEKLKERDELRNTLNSQKAWLLEQFDTVVVTV